ncbi:MAG TPA: HD domain-containing protein [candidate division Zixibacteria bacterium]|nr:HD domain-containing protein [candidate division Zixibacteria bacterium]
MAATQLAAKYVDQFIPIYLESLRIDSVLGFDLYTLRADKMVLYRSRELPFDEDNRTGLLDNNVDRLYTPIEQRRNYQDYLEKNLLMIARDSAIDEKTKTSIIYETATRTVQDVLSNPTLGDNIHRGKAVVEGTVTLLMSGQETFHSLLKVMSFDYYTYTHSLNVCAFAIALAQFMGEMSDEEMISLGTGALFHDVGKIWVDERILNKRGPLSEREFAIIRKHPRWGVELMRETGLIGEESYFPIIQHHEREDGSGYPRGLTSIDINPHSKIVAVADVFDAMTTHRVYRQAVETFPALMVMFGDKNIFDLNLLENFTRLMGPASITM